MKKQLQILKLKKIWESEIVEIEGKDEEEIIKKALDLERGQYDVNYETKTGTLLSVEYNGEEPTIIILDEEEDEIYTNKKKDDS